MYFEKFPKLDYFFPGVPSVKLLDVFRRVSFTQETLKEPTNFIQHTVKEGDKPEDIAQLYYDDARLWWLVLLANNIIDYRNEWPKSSREIDNVFQNFLKGNSYYVFEDMDVKPGDVIVRRDVNATGLDDDENVVHTSSLDMNSYGVVDSYDRLLHKIDIKKQTGTISTDDEIYLFRKGFTASGLSGSYYPIEGFGQTGCYRQWYGADTCAEIIGPTAGYEGGGGEDNLGSVANGPHCCTQGSTFAIVQKATALRNSAVRFEYKSADVNPYSIIMDDDGASGDFFNYQNLCGLTGTILYKYIRGDLGSDVRIITLQDDILDKNDRSRKINILDPSMLGQVLSEVGILLQNDVPRGTTKILYSR